MSRPAGNYAALRGGTLEILADDGAREHWVWPPPDTGAALRAFANRQRTRRLEFNRPGARHLRSGSDRAGGRHRKLMPTHHERLFHGVGAGDDLPAIEAAGGRVGGLICWENCMPMARCAVYRGGPWIWVAPTADDSDVWLVSMRNIAIESGAFVVSVPQFIPATAFPADFPVGLPEGKAAFGHGGAAVIEPASGEVIAGPLYGEEGILLADCDLRRGLHAKRLRRGRSLRPRGCTRSRAGRAEPSPPADPDRPNIAPTIWRTVSDLTSGLYFYESAFDPNIVWIRIADLDLSVGQPALKLDLHGESDLVGYVTSRLLPSDPFEVGRTGRGRW
jgi:hypothetical protein